MPSISPLVPDPAHFLQTLWFLPVQFLQKVLFHLLYKEGEAYKVTVFKRSGIRRKLKPETYLLQEENGNLFMNTGFRIDVSYNEATDILTFSPNGDYVRVNPKPDHPINEQ